MSWLHFLGRWGFGACLADDMGLGKTVQALALVQHLRENGHGHYHAAKILSKQPSSSRIRLTISRHTSGLSEIDSSNQRPR